MTSDGGGVDVQRTGAAEIAQNDRRIAADVYRPTCGDCALCVHPQGSARTVVHAADGAGQTDGATSDGRAACITAHQNAHGLLSSRAARDLGNFGAALPREHRFTGLPPIAGAAVDVLSVEPPSASNPLLAAKNCVITPHVAWATRDARRRLIDVTAANLAAFAAGQPQNVVNA
jgi:hypothetical protein